MLFLTNSLNGIGGSFIGTEYSSSWTCLPGQYTWKAQKYGHKTRTGTVNITEDGLELNIVLCPIGDASGDGNLNMGDVAKSYAHVRGSTLLTDEYAMSCADASGDGNLNMGDVAKVYSHIKGTNPLF
jgi:hypothetical protein